MEFKNHLIDQVLQQLGIEQIFSAYKHPQSIGKLEVFHKYLKPTLKDTMWKGSIKLAQVHKPSSHQLKGDTKPCQSWNTIFLGLQQRPQFTFTPDSRANAMIPRRSIIWITQPGSTLSNPSHYYEDSRWKPLQNCSENNRQRTTIIQDRWQSILQK